MELALLHFKIVVLDVGNELGYVCVLRHIVAIGHYAQMGFGSWDGHIEQVGVIGELCRSVINHAHDDCVTLTSLILMHRAGNVWPNDFIDFLCLWAIRSDDDHSAHIRIFWHHFLGYHVNLTLVEMPTGMIPFDCPHHL